MAQVEHYQTSNILIIDDEPANVLLLQSIFEASGYTRIKTTIDPRQVTSMVAMFEPDLILLDLHMPKKDGFEVLEWLRSSPDFRRIPACVLSGHDYPPYKDRAIGLGAREFYPKRADVGEFTELVRGICDKWLQPRV